MTFFQYFISIVLLSAFYSFAIVSLTYTLPDSDMNFIVQFSTDDAIRDYGETSREFQDSLQTQKQFGIVDAGALALFSGNILLDLAVNFFFAVPSMFALFFSAIFYFLKINVFLQNEIILLVKAILAIISSIFLIRFLLGARTQSLGAI